jgi:hypothetical protein
MCEPCFVKWLALLLAAALLGTGAFVYGGPARAARALRGTLVAGDAVDLEERVDFPRLREQLKRSLHQVVTEAAPNKDSALAASALVEPIANGLVQPAALLQAASGKAAEERAQVSRWTSLFTAEVGVEGEDSAPRLSFERRGLRWVLVGLELPAALRAQLTAALHERAGALVVQAPERQDIKERSTKTCLRSQRGAQQNLFRLSQAQARHREEQGAYTRDLAALRVDLLGNPLLYDYEVVALSPAGFRLAAVGRGPMAGDRWEIDEPAGLQVIASVCGGNTP